MTKKNRKKRASYVSFYSNGTAKDKEAEGLLRKAGIPFTTFGPTSVEPTPFIWYNNRRVYRGLENIKCFIENWGKGLVPKTF